MQNPIRSHTHHIEKEKNRRKLRGLQQAGVVGQWSAEEILSHVSGEEEDRLQEQRGVFTREEAREHVLDNRLTLVCVNTHFRPHSRKPFCQKHYELLL